MTELNLVQHRHPADVGRYEWQPFDRDDNFTYTWWHQPWDLGRRYSLWSVVGNAGEIARIQLDEEVHYSHYSHVPDLGTNVLKVHLFEVSANQRSRGLGRAALELVARRHPGRRLVAFSERADGFWTGLGWRRYDHAEGADWYQPFFVAPDDWSDRTGH